MHTPIENIIRQNYGFTPTHLKQLDGYANKNYLIKDGKEKYIFKTYPFESMLFDTLKAEDEILTQLSTGGNNRYSMPMKPIATIEINGQKTIIRLLNFLEGNFIGDTNINDKLLRSFGTAVAKMNTQLLKMTNKTIQERLYNWDISQYHLNIPFIPSIENPADRKIVAYFFQQYKEKVLPIQSNLRKNIIHSDANEWNVLHDNNRVTGIIDFGDMVYAPLINEVATTLSYIIYRAERGLNLATPFLSAYHQILPLQKKEIDILYYLIATKLCISVCNSAHALKQNPNNKYIAVSEKPAWRMLRYWQSINPIEARNLFRKAVST